MRGWVFFTAMILGKASFVFTCTSSNLLTLVHKTPTSKIHVILMHLLMNLFEYACFCLLMEPPLFHFGQFLTLNARHFLYPFTSFHKILMYKHTQIYKTSGDGYLIQNYDRQGGRLSIFFSLSLSYTIHLSFSLLQHVVFAAV